MYLCRNNQIMKIVIRGVEYVAGQPINCYFVRGINITGTLHIAPSGRFYICHNDHTHYHGSVSPVLYGHSFSWVFRYDSESDCFTEDVVSIMPCNDSPHIKEAVLCGELEKFFQTLKDNMLYYLYLMRVAVKPFECYNNYTISKKPGYIVMSGNVKTQNGLQEKKVEIKLSRFIKKVDSAIKEAGVHNPGLTDSDIEKVYNKYVAFQNGESFKFEILKGKDILKAYDSTKYSSIRGVLHKSCMSDKFHLLSLYTDNKEVSLATLSTDGSYVARCLIWEIDGKYYFDRIYYSIDWIEKTLQKKLEDLGYINLKTYFEVNMDNPFISIKLANTEFEKYPYLDSFRCLSNGTLYYKNEKFSVSSLPSGKYKVLVATNGSYEEALSLG